MAKGGYASREPSLGCRVLAARVLAARATTARA